MRWKTPQRILTTNACYNFDREKLADADPPVEELAQRLRSWDAAMTRLKTDGLLAELPTKRLLMQYTQGFVDHADPPGNLQVQCTGRDLWSGGKSYQSLAPTWLLTPASNSRMGRHRVAREASEVCMNRM